MIGHQTEFPKHFARYTTAQLLGAYRRGPERIRQALEGLSLDELRARPRGPDKWSAIEIVLHVADSEAMGFGRIRLNIAQPGATYLPYNQDLWTRGLGHCDAGLDGMERALRVFETIRDATVPLLETQPEQVWQQTGTHPEWGPLTLRNLLELYADHSERHLDQLLEIRRLLGKPLGMKLLLEERLY